MEREARVVESGGEREEAGRMGAMCGAVMVLCRRWKDLHQAAQLGDGGRIVRLLTRGWKSCEGVSLEFLERSSLQSAATFALAATERVFLKDGEVCEEEEAAERRSRDRVSESATTSEEESSEDLGLEPPPRLPVTTTLQGAGRRDL